MGGTTFCFSLSWFPACFYIISADCGLVSVVGIFPSLYVSHVQDSNSVVTREKQRQTTTKASEGLKRSKLSLSGKSKEKRQTTRFSLFAVYKVWPQNWNPWTRLTPDEGGRHYPISTRNQRKTHREVIERQIKCCIYQSFRRVTSTLLGWDLG